jgi:hypothetical protein
MDLLKIRAGLEAGGLSEANIVAILADAKGKHEAEVAKAQAERAAKVEGTYKAVLAEVATQARELLEARLEEEGIDASLFPGAGLNVRFISAVEALDAAPAILDEKGATVRPAIEAREFEAARWLEHSAIVGPTTVRKARDASQAGVARTKLAHGQYQHAFKDGTVATWHNDGTESATAAARRELTARGLPTTVNGLIWWRPVTA